LHINFFGRGVRIDFDTTAFSSDNFFYDSAHAYLQQKQNKAQGKVLAFLRRY
jgi:hypothetical protein